MGGTRSSANPCLQQAAPAAGMPLSFHICANSWERMEPGVHSRTSRLWCRQALWLWAPTLLPASTPRGSPFHPGAVQLRKGEWPSFSSSTYFQRHRRRAAVRTARAPHFSLVRNGTFFGWLHTHRSLWSRSFVYFTFLYWILMWLLRAMNTALSNPNEYHEVQV